MRRRPRHLLDHDDERVHEHVHWVELFYDLIHIEALRKELGLSRRAADAIRQEMISKSRNRGVRCPQCGMTIRSDESDTRSSS